MTYEQALTLLRQRYGATPWTQASGSEVQSFLRSQGVPSAYVTQIGTAYYTAQRTNSSIDNVLQTKGLYTPSGTTTTAAVAPVPTATTTGTTPPVIAVPSFTTPPTNVTPTSAQTPSVVTTNPVSTIFAPSSLASQESGAIGAASIASQMANNLPTVSPTLPGTAIATAESEETRALKYLTNIYGDNLMSVPLQNIITTLSAAQITSAGTQKSMFSSNVRMRIMDAYKTAASSNRSLQDVFTTPTAVSPVGTVAGTQAITGPAADVATTTPISLPTLTNPLAPTTSAGQAVTVEGGGTLQNPLATTTPSTIPPVTAAMGGSLEDQINYQSAIRRLTAQLQRAQESAGQQAGEVRAVSESQIRKAGRDLYNAQVKSLASLAARGISGAPGLSVAAQRAGAAEPEFRRQTLISDRDRQLSALNRTLTTQLGDYEEELRKNQEQLTRATTLANKLTGTE